MAHKKRKVPTNSPAMATKWFRGPFGILMKKELALGPCIVSPSFAADAVEDLPLLLDLVPKRPGRKPPLTFRLSILAGNFLRCHTLRVTKREERYACRGRKYSNTRLWMSLVARPQLLSNWVDEAKLFLSNDAAKDQSTLEDEISPKESPQDAEKRIMRRKSLKGQP